VARLGIAAGARVVPRMVEEDLPDELGAVIDESLRSKRE
jgi:hypothetical protein